MIKAVFFNLEMLSGYENSVALGNADELAKKPPALLLRAIRRMVSHMCCRN